MISMNNNLFNTIKNGAFLIVSQSINYVMPLLILPHLAKNLSVEKFGVVVFGISLMQMLNIIIDFGFSLSGVKINSEKNKNLFYTTVYIIKVLIFFLATIIFFGILYFQNLFNEYYFLSFMWAAAFFSGLAPSWLFSSIENTKPVMYTNFVAKILLVVLIFLLVDNDRDIKFIGISFFANSVLLFLTSFLLAKKIGFLLDFNINLIQIKLIFLDGLQFFWSRAAVTLYTSASVFFLGIYGGVAEAAKYSIAEQIYKSFQAIFGPISQAMYPYMVRTRNYKSLIIISLLCFLFASVFAIFFEVYGLGLIKFIFGEKSINSYETLKIFSIIIIVTSISVFVGYPLYGALGKVYVANNTVIFGGVVQIFSLCVMIGSNRISAENVALAVLLTEFCVFFLRIVLIGRKKDGKKW